MKSFRYDRPATVAAAVKALAGEGVLLKASGLDVLDRLKERVDEPDRIVTLTDLPGLDRIERADDGSFRLGALVTLAQLAASPELLAGAPALVEAAAGAASPQLRNRATLGGNLAQHTRCGYYRIRSFPCFKRGDAFCPVRVEGAVQEDAGIFGIDACACAHPSSLAPALGALGASVLVTGEAGERRLAFAELFAPPAQGRGSDTSLGPTDVITSIEVPASSARGVGAFYELRRRASHDWALVAAGVWFRVDGGAIAEARVWLGAVAPTPHEARAAARALEGQPFAPSTFAELAATAGRAAAEGATPLPGTAYKTELVQVAVKRALLAAAGRRA